MSNYSHRKKYSPKMSCITNYLSSRKIYVQEGMLNSPKAEDVSGVKYLMDANTLKLSDIILTLGKDKGTFSFTKDGKAHTLSFGIGENLKTEFSLGMRTDKMCMGKNEEGAFTAYSSGAWTEENKFSIKAQIIDNYFGQIVVHLYFKGDDLSMVIRKSGQYVLDGFAGYAIGHKE